EILVATPGRLRDHVQQKTVNLSQVQILVLDEADRMLDMGFLPDLKRIIALIPAQRQSLLFSATFSDDIKRLANQMLRDPLTIEVARRNAPADLVSHQVYEVSAERKRALLVNLIRTRNMTQVLVFLRMKKDCNKLARELERDGIKATAIHSDRTQAEREQALNDFKEGRAVALVATDIAARGLDIEELPYVVNYELPYVPEDYVHRIGRTGRAGMPGAAISLVCSDEAKLLADIERMLKRPIERLPVGELDHRHSRYEHMEHKEHKEHKERPHRDVDSSARAERSPRAERAPRPERAVRERPVETPIAKAIHGGFDFSKPYEPGNGETAETLKPAAPQRRGAGRPVAALLGGFSTPRK
ncbi:MAG TPA: helicase-related protein, partial [Burkholderiales bacterium]|nr:helicase-related protein [Burkholderiales bacterium]